jgi:transposase InsO family protein
MQQLLTKYFAIISEDKFDLGFCDKIKHQIRPLSYAPIHTPQFRIPQQHLEVVHQHVDELLKAKCIILSASPWNSPIFAVPKHDGSLRVVEDLRKVNANSYEDKYSCKSTQECIDDIGAAGSKLFCTIDLRAAFWQMALDKASQEMTAFTVPGRGRYAWTRVPMGLAGSPSSMQRLMDLAMTGMDGNVVCYVDDILVHAGDWVKLTEVLDEVFKRLLQFNLKINLDKSCFGVTHTNYLGHTITPEGVKPSFDKVKAVSMFPPPATVKQIREFVGLANYFRQYIPNFSRISAHLTCLTKHDTKWPGGPLPAEALAAFQSIKHRLTGAPLLAYPDPKAEYILTVDAATGDAVNPGGLGAILEQRHQDGRMTVVAYASRGLKTFEKNYTPFLVEMAAATWAVEHFHCYLYGSKRFTLQTDHAPLEKVSRLHQKTLNRLQQMLNQYNFVVQYKKGSDNAAADALSRNPVEALECSEDIMRELQQNDQLCYDIKQYVIKKTVPNSQQHAQMIKSWARKACIKNGILYAKLQQQGQEPRLVLWVPLAMQRELIHGAHATRYGGHAAVDKVVARILQQYYWPGMHATVQTFIDKCSTCQKTQRRFQSSAPVQRIKAEDRPNVRVHIDTFGPLKNAVGDKRHVIVMTDAFTKYSVVKSVPNKEAETIAAAIFDDWICKFSVMQTLVSDNGKEYCNKVVDELCKMLSIKRSTTAVVRPQCNGQAEVFNRTMIRYLTNMVEGDTLNWEKFIAPLTLFYNTQVHRATKHSPFYLTYLHPPRLPYFDMDMTPRYSMNWVEDAHKRMVKVHKLTRENIEQEQKASSENVTEPVIRTLKVGDPCMVHYDRGTKGTIGTNVKFESQWEDGYVVLKQLGPATYQVKKGKKQPKSIHIDRLKYDTTEREMDEQNTVRTNEQKLDFTSNKNTKLPILKKAATKQKRRLDSNVSLEMDGKQDDDLQQPQGSHQEEGQAHPVESDDEFYDLDEHLNNGQEEEEGRRNLNLLPATPEGRGGRARPPVSYREARAYNRRK